MKDFTTRTRKLEENASLWIFIQHLDNILTLFSDKNYYKWYMQSLMAASLETGVRLITFIVMPDHYHLIVEASGIAALMSFVKRANTSFSMKIKSAKHSNGEPKVRSERIFARQPYYIPITSYVMLFIELRYDYMNPVVWNENHDERSQIHFEKTTGLYWKSSFILMRKGESQYRFSAKPLERITGLTSMEILDAISQDEEGFNRFLNDFCSGMSPTDMEKPFKIDPSKPWTTDVSYYEDYYLHLNY